MASFLTCAAVRSIKRKDWVKSRSVCDYCKKPLGVFDLIPILSFVGTLGKTRCCGKKLSLLYPLSEVALGLSFVLVGTDFFPVMDIMSGIQVLLLFSILSLLWIVFVTDLLYEIIPFDVLFILIFLTFAFLFLHSPSCMSLSPTPCVVSLFPHFLSGFIPALFFSLLWFFSHGKAMGDGDITLVFLLGFFLGYPNIIVGLYVAFLTGAGAGVILILRRKKTLKSHISFGPFLIAGAFVAAVWGTSIIHFVTHLWL